MAGLDKWLKNQRPEIVKNVSIIRDVDFLHISQDATVRTMTPQIGWRQTKDEDRTVPRICGGGTVLNCILGHSQVIDCSYGEALKKNVMVAAEPVFYIYKIDGKEFIKPNKKLVSDSPITNELWLVAHSPDTVVNVPRKIGMFVPYLISTTNVLGEEEYANTLYIKVTEHLRLDDDYVLQPGCYKFNLNGDMSPFHGCKTNKITDVVPISNSDWNGAFKTAKAVNK